MKSLSHVPPEDLGVSVGLKFLMKRNTGLILAISWAILVHVPKFYAWFAATSSGGVFAGSVVNIHDHNLYLGSAQLGISGRIFETDSLFTSEDNLSAVFSLLPHAALFYRVLGLVYGLTHLPTNLFFIVVGLPFSVAAFLAYRALFAEVLPEGRQQRLATALLFTFPGIFWIEKILVLLPNADTIFPTHMLYTELWGIAPLNAISHSAYMPHFVAAASAMALAMRIVIRAVRTFQVNYGTLAVLSLLVAWLNPALGAMYLLVTGLFAFYVLVRWTMPVRLVFRITVCLLPAAVMAGMPIVFSLQDPVWAKYLRDAVPVNGFVDIVIWSMHLGVLGVLGLWGAIRSFRNASPSDPGKVLMGIWIAATFLISIWSLSGSTRLMDAIYLPAIVLSLSLMSNSDKAVQRVDWRLVLVGMMILPGTLITYVYPWAGHIFIHFVGVDTSLTSDDLWPIRLSIDETAALEWLARETMEEDLIVSGPVWGSFVPGFVGRQAYLGHLADTLSFGDKLRVVKQLGQSPSLLGVSLTRSIWIVSTYREPVAMPRELMLESRKILCSRDTTRIGSVTLKSYGPCMPSENSAG